MFSGIGGFELGIQNSYGTTDKEGKKDKKRDDGEGKGLVSQKGEGTGNEEGYGRKQPDSNPDNGAVCVGFSEIDRYAVQTYKRHFPSHKNFGDATKIIPEELPDFDMLCGGFPCQSFSIAGQRLGFKDTRGTLFFDIARIAKVKRPQYLFLENVKGLLSHDNGRTFAVILATLDELGYNAEWEVLNSRYFGVPQNRERVFIIGHLRGKGGRQIFPLGKDTGEFQEKDGGRQTLTESGISSTLKAPYYKISADSTYVVDMYNKKEHTDRTPTLTEPHHNSLRLRQGDRIRKLTPIECERLQGFPDNWTIGSDTQRYKQCGNAVTVNVIEAIVDKIQKNI